MDQNFKYTTWDKAPFGSEWLAHVDEGGLWPKEGELMRGTDEGASGYGSNYRHAGNVALLKNLISNKIATDTGISWLDKPTRKIGDIAGGIAGWGLGLGHELSAPSPILNKDINTGILDYGEVSEKTDPEAGLFSTEFLEDMAANKFGAMHGQTGITSANVVNELAKSLATEEGSDIDYLNELALKHQFGSIGKRGMKFRDFFSGPMNQEDFRSRFMNRYNVSPYEKNRRRLIEEQRRAQLKRQMNLQSTSSINAMKEQIGMPDHLTPPKIIPKHSPHGGGPGTVSTPPPSTPTGTGGPPSIISRPPPSAPIRTGGPPSQGGGGGGPPSRGGGSPRGGSSRGAGRNPWGRADGGLINLYRYGGFSG